MTLSTSADWATALKSKLISTAILDPLFRRGLDEAAQDIRVAARAAPNEATVENAFDSILYAVLKAVGVTYLPDKERRIGTRRHTAKGRTDSRIGRLVIEYKHASKLLSDSDIRSATSQLDGYLCALSDETEGDAVGFLTDGLHIYEVRANGGAIQNRSGRKALDTEALERLTRCIVSLSTSALNPQNLVRDFCGDDFNGVIFSTARILEKILRGSATPKTKMLFSEWEALFRLAHNDQSQQKRIQDRRKILGEIYQRPIGEAHSEYVSLFALHTSYAILLKMIAYRIVSDIRFGTVLQDYKSLLDASGDNIRAFCWSLEDGDLFRSLGIVNLLEGDFFSWYADATQWNPDLAEAVRRVLTILARYEDVKAVFESRTAVDLFRTLYEATVPQVIRASFGEFYTPHWLAEHVLQTSGAEPGWTALDPCCGSGTFVITAIGRLREEMAGAPKEELCDAIFHRVAAIDLNPLAVLTTRVHFFIHVADLLPKHIGQIVIPVYLGDASYVPSIEKEEGVRFVAYELRTLKTPIDVRLPVALARDTAAFLHAMVRYEAAIKERDAGAAAECLFHEMPQLRAKRVVRRNVEDLTNQLIDLESKGWNGIWARIIANFVITASLPKYTNVVGNPPWIDWKNLPEGYRERVKGLCIDKGLFSGAGRTGGINLNICALIAHVCATNWLADKGRLAFLMPRELANQASYEGWREAVGGAGCKLVEFHDWSEAGHPFDPVKEDFMTFVLEHGRADGAVLPMHQYAKKDGRLAGAHKWASLEEAASKLEARQAVAARVIRGSTAYTVGSSLGAVREFARIAGQCAYLGREGIEFYPQELLLFTYNKQGPQPGTVFVNNVQKAKSKYKVPSQQILLEAAFLHPLVKGPNIERFAYNDPQLIVAFPYHDSDPHRPLEQRALRRESPLLLRHYRKYEDLIRGQTGYSDTIRADGEFYGLARTGPYSFASFYVAFRDNTKWRATVIGSKKMPWGERRRFLFQNHAVSICEPSDRSRFITQDEAHYVCGIMNTEIVEEFVYASSDNRSFKIRPPIYVPLYDSADPTHVSLAALAKAAHAAGGCGPAERRGMEDLYLKICASNPRAVAL